MNQRFHVQASNVLLASSMSFTARERHFNNTGGESNPQRVNLAVYLHANDSLVVHTIYTAPRREQKEDTTRLVYSLSLNYLVIYGESLVKLKVIEEKCERP